MKEIKFRVYDKDAGHMVSPGWWVAKLTNSWHPLPHELYGDADGRTLLLKEINKLFTSREDLIWMQYTGLHDKNDRPIYESDVVVLKSLSHTVMDIVTYERGAFGLGLEEGFVSFHYGEEELSWEDYEVIGDIYTHPHLLKQILDE